MQCKNCNEKLHGKQHFCSNCGQKNIPHLTFKYLFEEFLENYVYLDSKLFVTLRHLLFNPGFLSLEFIKGKRVSYVAPVRLYITFSVLFFFIIAVTSFFNNQSINSDTKDESLIHFSFNEKQMTITQEQYENLKKSNQLQTYMRDSLKVDTRFEQYLAEKAILAQHDNEHFRETLLNQLSLFLILFIPFISLIYKWSFIKNKYGYIKHMVFNIHFNSFIILVLTFNWLIYAITDFDSTFYFILVFGSILFILIYLFLGLRKFYNRKKWVITYKLLILLIGYISLAVLFFLLLLLFSLVIS